MKSLKGMVGIVRQGRNGNVTNIKSEYETKKDFIKDLRGNGYRVLAVFTKEEVRYIKHTPKSEMKDSFLFSNYNAIEYIKQCL